MSDIAAVIALLTLLFNCIKFIWQVEQERGKKNSSNADPRQ